MERKLELKDIAGYLPYGELYFYDEIDNKESYVVEQCMCYAKQALDDCQKIILRPLSDLYRTITHNGKEITPIVEIAKMARKNYDWKFTGGNICFCRNLINELQQFYFENGSFILYLEGESYCLVNNQYQLFDYMNELKVDYRGLIDAGLAISVYDLKTNPYK